MEQIIYEQYFAPHYFLMHAAQSRLHSLRHLKTSNK